MFGYIKPHEYHLFVKDVALYKSLYCGLCKSIGKGCNQIARFSVSYDTTFLSALLHNTEGVDVTVEKQRCCAHWFTKRPVALPDELSVILGKLNVLLAFRKLLDDKVDENKGGVKRTVFRRAYKKAKKSLPDTDTAIKEEYESLWKMEKAGEDSPDKVADAFGVMMQRVLASLPLKNHSAALTSLAYSLGKWIYLADALDDFEKDIKRKTYNVFALSYPEVKTHADLIAKHGGEITSLFASTLSGVQTAYADLKFYFNHDLLDNIVYRGLSNETQRLLKKGEKDEKSL